MKIEYINKNTPKLNIKEIDVKNFNNLSPIYSFTTENIARYFEYLDFIISVKLLFFNVNSDLYSG